MRRRLTLYIFLIAAFAVVVSSAMGVWVLREHELEETRRALVDLLELMDARRDDTDPESMIAHFSAAVPDKRLTVIAADGAVLADSDLETREDHSTRPEVAEALERGWGMEERRSATTGENMLYVAKRFADGAVVRVGTTLSSVYGLVLRSAVGLVGASVLVLVLAFVLARRLAVRTARPVEQAAEAIQQVDETLQLARSEFTANVTHELKTPLTSIKGFADMLSSGLVKEEDRQRFLSMISVETDRLTKLVNDILKVSELEVVGSALPGEHCDLLAVAGKAAELLAPAARGAQVELRLTGERLTGAISADRFEEVALNLMENAVKYNRPGGRVAVTLEERDGRAVFTVADTGIGIPPESRERVFERLYRVDKGRSRAAGGTGLGLAIVKHIVALYGGAIWLDSAVGSGTTVTVELPLSELK